MNKLNVSQWQSFTISELFITESTKNKIQVPTGASISKVSLIEQENGGLPRITVTGVNNGIIGHYKEMSEPNYRVFENFISISFLGTIFYHPYKASLDMKVHCLKLRNKELNANIALFLIGVIKKHLYSFAYDDQLSSTVLPTLSIRLPIRNGIPDWEYMENFIYNIHKKEISNQYYITQYIDRSQSKKIDLSNWRKFHLYDKGLFEIDMGTKLDKVKMTQQNPTVNFIGRANKNNGITEYVDLINDINPYEAGNLTLSLGGEYLGSCFIQPSPFYTSQNVIVLKPTWDMSFNVKMFISIMVFRESRQFYKAFIDELNRHIKTDFSIYLPIDKAGEPDWEYMEQFIDNLYDKEREKIKVILSIH
ncbi:restriction endonuclease subunit S [Lonepinella koalarum]|uniref:restriction endonuclease subunit S n=1 Tax=Lonepinella koalarum TaxID=53417 RepID=UPI003F6E0358